MTPERDAKRIDRQPVDEHWRAVHRALLYRIEYRERELRELHDEYIEQQLALRELRREVFRLQSALAVANARLSLDATLLSCYTDPALGPKLTAIAD